jgi:RNA polymerase sigma-70 factor, ECF subfamily
MEAPDFGSLYQRYSRDVLRFALYLTGSRSEAEDIVSETFVRAWLSASPIRDGTVKSYLLAIAQPAHRAASEKRSHGRVTSYAEAEDCGGSGWRRSC